MEPQQNTQPILTTRQLAAIEIIRRKKASSSLVDFITYTKPNYETNWHHLTLCKLIDQWVKGDINKLCVEMPPRHGKLLADDVEVLTVDGWKLHGDLRVGDKVFGAEGLPVRVTHVFPKHHTEFVVLFTDGAKIDCHGDHLWPVYDQEARKRGLISASKLFEAGLCRYLVDERTVPPCKERAILAVEPAPPKQGNCITVEGGIYLVGRTLIPTHNSEAASRRLPAYLFGIDPDETVIACSSTQRLASRMSRDVQRIIDSPAYRRIFPNSFLNDKNVRTVSGSYLRNNETFELVNHLGTYISSGIGGTIGGMGANRLILDDYLKNRKDADSRTIRENQWEWWVSTFTTRGEKDASILITTTRWHQDDLVGRILSREKDEWTVLKLPAICEDADAPFEQRQVGEPLWPNKYSLDHLLAKQAESIYNFSALYQQNPTPRTGGFIKVEKITIGTRKDDEMWPRVRYWDLGGSDAKTNDRTSGTLMRREGPKRVIEDCTAGQWSPAERNKVIVETAKLDAKLGAVTWIEKVPGLAVEVIQTIVDLFIENGLAIHTEMAHGSKETRADPFATAVENGRVEMCLGEWNREFRDELQGFPYASNDDRVDSTSGAFNKLIERQSDAEEEVEVLDWRDLSM